MVVVLIPKRGGDYYGIGLLKPTWKVLEILMDRRLDSIEFRDYLHGFLAARGTGTSTTEAKLAQQLAYLAQEPLYEIFINLRKAYDAMDRGRCLRILRAYEVGPNIIRLMKHFWTNAQYACRTGGYYGHRFKTSWGTTHRGTTQGDPSHQRFSIL